MENIKNKIIEILINHQESVKIGNDGDYYTEKAVMSENYESVANEISIEISENIDEVLKLLTSFVREKKDKSTAMSFYIDFIQPIKNFIKNL
jgi:hypothetical protein